MQNTCFDCALVYLCMSEKFILRLSNNDRGLIAITFARSLSKKGETGTSRGSGFFLLVIHDSRKMTTHLHVCSANDCMGYFQFRTRKCITVTLK